jgi:hypothetical protein
MLSILGVHTRVSELIADELRPLERYINPHKVAIDIERRLMAQGHLSQTARRERLNADSNFTAFKRGRRRANG